VKNFSRYVSLGLLEVLQSFEDETDMVSQSLPLHILLQMLMDVEIWREALNYCRLIVPVYQSMFTSS